MREISIKAAKLWAKYIKDDHDIMKFDETNPYSLNSWFAYMLQDKVSDEQCDEFVNLLSKYIDELLDTYSEIYLYSNRYPCEQLERISNMVGISGLSFPWNTYMTINNDRLVVKPPYTDKRITINA